MSPEGTITDNWIEDYLRPRYPELVDLYQKAREANRRIREQGRIEPGDLQPIIDIVRSNRKPLYDNGIGMLGRLTGKYPEVLDAIARMAEDKQAHIRHNAICCMNRRETPRDFAITLMRRTLADRSSRVRMQAANQSLKMSLTEIVPELETALQHETHEVTARSIDFCLRLLRDGYILEDKGNDNFSITIPKRGGINMRDYSRGEIEGRGLNAIIEEMHQPSKWQMMRDARRAQQQHETQ